MIISFRLKLLASAAFVFLGFLAFVPSTFAATRTWDGGGTTNNWSECANWDGPDTCPTTADVATFSGTSTKAATIDTLFTTGVTTFNMNAGYTGIITQARSFAVSGTATIASGTFNGSTDTFSTAAMTVSGGTFTGGNQTVSHTGTFTLSSGTYTASSGTTTFSGAYTHTSGGTFAHNNGSVVFTGAATTTNVTTTESFYNVEVNKNNAVLMTISSGDTLTVNNTLTLTNGGFTSGTMNAKNTMSLNSGWDGGGTGILLIDGTNTQNLALNGAQAALASTITVNNTNFTFSGTGTGALNFNVLNLQAGTITATGYDVAVAGAFTQSGGTFTGGGGAITHTGAWTLSGGTYTATSGLTTFAAGFTHTAGGTFTHNNGAVSFTGAASTTNVTATESFYDLTVAKNTGVALTVSSGDTLIVSHALTLTDGAFATGTIESTGTLSNGAGWDGFTNATTGTLLIDGTGVATSSLTGGQSALASTITVNNTNFTFSGTGTGALNFNILNLQAGTITATGYDVAVAGAFTQSGGTFTGGGGAITHTGAWTLSGGTYTATSGTTTFSAGFTHTAGGTFTHNNGLVSFTGATATANVAVTESFYDLTVAKNTGVVLTVSSGDTLIVSHALTLTDGAFATGTMESTGTISYSADWDGYTAATTGTILLSGTNTSSLSLNSGQSAIAAIVTLNNANFTINGTGAPGTLNLRAFNLQAGTFDATGYDVAITSTGTQSGGTFTMGSGALVFSSTFVISVGTFNGGSGTVTHTGALTISGGTYNATSGTTNVSSSFTHTAGGTFVHSNGVLVANGSAAVWDTAVTETVYGVTINTTGNNILTVATGDTFIVNGLLTLTNGQFSIGTLSVRGNMDQAATWDGGTGGGEIRVEGTGAQAVTLADGGVEPANTFTVNNADAVVTMPATGTFLFYVFDLQAGTIEGQGSTVTFPTTCTQSGGTVNAGTGAFVYSIGCSQSGGTFNGETAAVTYSSTFTLSGGTYNASSGITTIAAGFTHTAGGTFSAPAGTVRFTGGNSTIDVMATETFYTVEIAKTSGLTLTVAASDTLAIAGNLTLTDGAVGGSTGLISVQGNVTVASTWDGGTTPMTFTGSGTQTFDLTGATGLINSDITVNKTGGKVTLLSVLVEDASSQDLVITQGTFALGGFDLTVNGSAGAVTVANTGVLELQGGEVLTFNASNPVLQAGSLVKYVGAVGPYTLKNYTYQSVEIAGGAAVVFVLPGTLSLAQNLTITSGVLSLAGSGLTVTGTYSNLGTLRLRGAETVTLTNDTNSGTTEYVGDADAAADAFTLKNWVYYNLLINFTDAADSATAAASPLDVDGALTIAAGVFTAPVSITLAGNFTHSGGTFTHNSGTVTFDGTSQAISGTTTFNNLTKSVAAAATLTFPASTTQTIVGTLTLNGADGQVLSLRSSTPDTQFSIDPQGTRTVSYLNVKDSNNIHATAISCTTGCVNANGNTNWSFVSAGVTVTESGGTTAATEGGATDTYDVVLISLPSATVTVTLSPDSQVSASAATLTFTTENWNTPQTVTVTAVNDASIEGGHSGTITHAVTSADPGYNGVSAASVVTAITDNDTAGFTVSAISGNTTEAGGTATATIVLTAEPTADVIVGLTSSDTTEGTISPASFTFTSVNWATPQTVTATGVNDDLDDGDIAYTITTAAAVSDDTNYSALNPSDVSVSNTDNDASGFTVSAISGNTTEAGGTATATIVLTAQPTASVTVELTSSDTGEGMVSPASFTFTTVNWATPQTVTATGVNDLIDDGDVVYAIVTAAATSDDTNYNTLNPDNISVTNTDNDTAGATASAISGNTSEDEETTATFTVVLTAEPTADVVIGISSSDTTEGTVSPASLTFTSLNWTTPQTVTVTGVNDYLDDGNVSFSAVLGAITSDDVAYSGLNPSDVTVVNDDDDASGFSVGAISGNTTEVGGTATFTIVLTAQPTASVTVGLTSSDTGEGTVSPVSVTFTTGNWNTPKTVTATGVDDVIDDGTVAYSIVTAAATSVDTNYDGLNPANVSVSTTDDDTAGITVGAISGNTSEAGATATFTVVLNTEPTADVVIGLTSNDTGEGTVSPASLTFTSANWDDAQTVTVTGVNDDLDDGDISYSVVTAAATSGDVPYSGLNAADVSVSNTDNDTSGFTVSAISGNTTEVGGTATATIVLTAQPTASVTVGITSSDTTEGTVSPASFTFTTVNWATPQTITVTGVNDDLDDGDIAFSIVTAAATSVDTNYDTLNPANVAVTNTDNDTSGFTVSAISGNTTEAGGTATFTVVLNAQPTADVSVGITSNDTSEGTVAPASLTFTSGNWSSAQTVTVTGVDDGAVDGSVAYSIVTAAAVSDDLNYNGINPGDVAVTTTDNDVVGISVSAISGNTTEAGGTATFTVVLTSQPSADVVIGLTSNDTGEGTVAPASLTFTSLNWNTPQTVTVTGVNDDLDDGDISYSIITAAATSADETYNGSNAADVSATNTDNDASGVTVGAISGNTTEAGGTATFTVVLTSQPTANVAIAVSSLDIGEAIVSASSLTFTTVNWATPQTITVTGVDDWLVDGNVATTVVLAAATSDDVIYNGINPSDVGVTNNDNDTAGITIAESDATTVVTEAGATDTYTVVLTAEPTDDVTVALTVPARLLTDETSVVFTSLNWNTPQTITVSSDTDAIASGDEDVLITHGVTSDDVLFAAVEVSDVSVHRVDNDTAGITVGAISGSTTEAGGTATFTVVLTSQPTANVAIGVSSSNVSEGTAAPASLTFTAGNWSTPQTVTVTGVDDGLVDGSVAFSILLAAAVSDDAFYNALNPADVSATNTDNDSAAVLVTMSEGATIVTEAGATDSYTLVLTAQPSVNVVVSITAAAGITTDISEATFTTVNWATPQTITVTALNDSIQQGTHSHAITHASTSDDVLFSGLTISDVNVSVTDNDSAGFTIGAISGNTTEAAVTATFTIVLNTEPTADVVIGLTSSDTGEGTVSPASLTFTALNWASVQTVTITGVNDNLDDGDIAYSIVTSAVVSDDAFYSAINPSDISVTSTDNDTAGITLVESSDVTAVTEGGDDDAYTLVLNSQPTASVNVFMIGDADITTAVAQLIFTVDNWNVPQAVVVSAVNDSTVETEEVHSILHVVTSADSLYAAVVVAGVPVTVVDDDVFEDPSDSGGSSSGGATTPVKTGPSIKIKMPASGATYALGALHVSWTSTGTVPAVNVYVSYDDGTTWALQRYFVTNSGSTTVNLEQESLAARVRVDGTNFISVLVSDESGSFAISSTASADANGAGTLSPEDQQAADAQAIDAVAARVAALPASFAIHSLVKILSDDNVTTQRDSTIYYIGADGYRHAFPNGHVFGSWFCPETTVVQVVSLDDLATVPLGPNVTYRPGNKMVKFITDPRVYVVDSDGSLRWVLSEDNAKMLYGDDWSKHIYDIADTFYRNYTFGTVLTDLSWDREDVRRSVLYPSDVMNVPGHLPDVDPNSDLCFLDAAAVN